LRRHFQRMPPQQARRHGTFEGPGPGDDFKPCLTSRTIPRHALTASKLAHGSMARLWQATGFQRYARNSFHFSLPWGLFQVLPVLILEFRGSASCTTGLVP
jgi:hypothetical protein